MGCISGAPSVLSPAEGAFRPYGRPVPLRVAAVSLHLHAHMFIVRLPAYGLYAAEPLRKEGGLRRLPVGEMKEDDEGSGEAGRRRGEEQGTFDHARSMCVIFDFYPRKRLRFPR